MSFAERMDYISGFCCGSTTTCHGNCSHRLHSSQLLRCEYHNTHYKSGICLSYIYVMCLSYLYVMCLSYVCYVSGICLPCVSLVSVMCLSYVCYMSVMCLSCVCRVQVCHRFLWMHAVNQISFMMSYVQQQANKIAQC